VDTESPTHDDGHRLIREACEALSIAYARAIDFRDYETFVELFAEDGVLEVGDPLEGREAIAAAMRHRPDELRSRHVISNIFVDVLSKREARGISYVTVYRHVGPESVRHGPAPLDGPAAVGHYEDRFVRTAEGWRFKRRRLQLAFRRGQ
jgi:hypothetical protein